MMLSSGNENDRPTSTLFAKQIIDSKNKLLRNLGGGGSYRVWYLRRSKDCKKCNLFSLPLFVPYMTSCKGVPEAFLTRSSAGLMGIFKIILYLINNQ